jgi:hypothetical protein
MEPNKPLLLAVASQVLATLAAMVMAVLPKRAAQAALATNFRHDVASLWSKATAV